MDAKAIGIIILTLLVIAIFPWVTMSIWNYLVPILFPKAAIGVISYWQAWGLLILTSLLFRNTNSSRSR